MATEGTAGTYSLLNEPRSVSADAKWISVLPPPLISATLPFHTLVGRVPGVLVERETELPAALKVLHGSLWGQSAHSSDRAVEGAAARVLQTDAGWVCALSPPVPAQRHLPRLSRKSKSLAPPPRDKGPEASPRQRHSLELEPVVLCSWGLPRHWLNPSCL